MSVYQPVLAKIPKVFVVREPHPIRLMSFGKCPKCGQFHSAVGMKKSPTTPNLYRGTCPTSKKHIFVVE